MHLIFEDFNTCINPGKSLTNRICKISDYIDKIKKKNRARSCHFGTYCIYASRDGSDKSAHLNNLIRAFVTFFYNVGTQIKTQAKM